MQIAYHGNYVKYMEVARCALLRKIGYDYNQMSADGYVWPVVDLHIKYIRPMTFMQKIRAEATLLEYEVCLKLSYKFMDAETGALLTKAESTQMAMEMKTNDSLWTSPKCFVDKVNAYLAKNMVV